MYLYKNWIRYIVKEDLSSPNKKEAIKNILAAIDKMRLTLTQIESIIPMRFTQTPSGIVAPVDKNAFPYLDTIITKQKVYGNMAEKLAHPGSIAIFKEAYLFLNQFSWVYTYDYSYEHVIAKQIGMWMDPRKKKSLLLVPSVFEDNEFITLLTDEVPVDVFDKTWHSIKDTEVK